MIVLSYRDVLKHLSVSLNKITDVMDSGNNSVEINPVSKKIKDLLKVWKLDSMISIQDKTITNQGMGTRSWATFLTLSHLLILFGKSKI